MCRLRPTRPLHAFPSTPTPTYTSYHPQGTQRLYDSLASKAGASLGLFEAVCGGSGVFRPHVEVAVPQVRAGGGERGALMSGE